jgi:hypothetical protein
MNGVAENIDRKQALRWKAVWLSLVTPICSFFVIWMIYSDTLPNIPNSVYKAIVILLFLTQITSLAAGVFGLFTKGALPKLIAALGIVACCIVGFLDLILIAFAFGTVNLGMLEGRIA